MINLPLKIRHLIFILPFFIFTLFLFDKVNYPFVGQNAYNYIIYSLIAHNYVQFGLLPTKLASIVSVSTTLPPNPEYFFHHPPLTSLIQAIFIKIFGDGFWQARIPVLLFALGTQVVIYQFLKKIGNGKMAFIAASIYLLVPAASFFGKMIGQETLVLFFIVACAYLCFLYLDSGKSKYLYFSIVSIIFATLSDWPAVLFSIVIQLLFLKHGKIKKGLLLPICSIATAVVLVIWIAWIRGGIWDLQNAIFLRSVLGLINTTALWPIYWVASLVLRVFLYFNPVFVVFAFYSLFAGVSAYRKKRLTDLNAIIFIFFIFGFSYIALYTQAVFTHPYLIYYLLPFVVFGSIGIFEDLIKRNKGVIIGLFIFSFIYLSLLYFVKEKQLESNVWRYEIASYLRGNFKPYETIIYNRYYVIDPDIWLYPLLINPRVQDNNNSEEFLKNYDHYVYSCNLSCNGYEEWIESLKKRYKYLKYNSVQSEGYLFFLKEKQNGKNSYRYIPTTNTKSDWVVIIYRIIRDKLNIQQI